MAKLKFGVVGAGRGSGFVTLLRESGALVLAFCDKDETKLSKVKEENPGNDDMLLFTDYDEFLKCDMDAVILANYFCDHAEFACRAMRAGKHVLSETISNVTMAQGVELVRCQKETGKIYALLENYPYMKQNLAMEKLYKSGKLGKAVYAEGEYVHPMDTEQMNRIAPNPLHWRNWTPRTYYSTHALAPLMKMTDDTPKRVTAMASFAPETAKGTASHTGDAAAIMLIQTESGAVFRVTGWAAFQPRGSHYRLCCTKGGAEINPQSEKMRISYNEWTKPNDAENAEDEYEYSWPDEELGKQAENKGHGGADYMVICSFVKSLEKGEVPYWDVYRATAMASCAILGWQSVLQGSIPFDIPDFRKEEDLIKYENDTQTPYPTPERDADIPCSSKPYSPSFEDMESAQKYWDLLKEQQNN